MITLFEKFENTPDVNSVSDKFWEMVEVANWNAVVKGYKGNPIVREDRQDFYKQAQNRIYSKYTFKEIENFNNEYHKIYTQVYNYFEPIWLDEKYSDVMPSDDGYTDLISSLIGKGKKYTKICIEHTGFFIQMARDDDYVENFGYILNVDEDEYWEIKEEFDPLLKDVRKYNL